MPREWARKGRERLPDREALDHARNVQNARPGPEREREKEREMAQGLCVSSLRQRVDRAFTSFNL